MSASPLLTGVERRFHEDEIIVSKTDLRGRITYANTVFMRVAGYEERELLGMPHNLIRHPAMPRAVFKLLWDTIGAGREIFAYVVNRAHNGDHYWVLAHVTPSFDASGAITGYHSFRRCPDRSAVAIIEPLYRELLTIEQRAANPRDGMAAAAGALAGRLQERGLGYDAFVFSL